MSKVSVIVPVYNAQKYLKECLESLLRQTESDIQIICVDDGSTDESYEILKSYQKRDDRIEVYQSTNQGGGSARNLGMKYAKGEYLSFLDADDFMKDTFIEQMYEKAKEVQADVMVCSVSFLYQVTGALRETDSGLRMYYLPKKEVFSYKDMPKYIFNTFHNWPWNKIFRRKFIQEHQIQFQEILRTNDLLFTCKALMEAKRISFLEESLVTYRIDEEGNSCQRSNHVQGYGFYQAFSALKEYLQEKGTYQQVKESYVQHALDGCIANLNTQEFSEGHRALFEKLKSEIFAALDICDIKEYYQYNIDSKTTERYQQILKGDYTEYMIYRASELHNQLTSLSHDIYHTDRKVEWQQKRIHILTEEMVHLKIAMSYLDGDRRFEQDDRRAVYESFSYRFGHKITSFPRWCYRKLRGR